MAAGSLILFPRRRPSRLDTYGQWDGGEPSAPVGAGGDSPGKAGRPGRHGPDGSDYQAAFASLSKREWDVLRLLAEGLNDRDIAVRLGIGRDTVRSHMVRLLGKLGAESRLQALVLAVRHGKVEIR